MAFGLGLSKMYSSKAASMAFPAGRSLGDEADEEATEKARNWQATNLETIGISTSAMKSVLSLTTSPRISRSVVRALGLRASKLLMILAR